MAKFKPTPGKMVNEAPKLDMKGIVKNKGENLAGSPRSGGIDPKDKPSGKGFSAVTKIRGSGKNK